VTFLGQESPLELRPVQVHWLLNLQTIDERDRLGIHAASME